MQWAGEKEAEILEREVAGIDERAFEQKADRVEQEETEEEGQHDQENYRAGQHSGFVGVHRARGEQIGMDEARAKRGGDVALYPGRL